MSRLTPQPSPEDAALLAQPLTAALAARVDAEDAEREARLNHPAALASAALWYASQGIAVFPLAVGDKLPLIRSAHPAGDPLRNVCTGGCGRQGHGFKDATCDPSVVRKWWARTPQANIGAPTGIASDVIDVDGPAGYASLAELEAGGFDPGPVLAWARTPRGLHLHVAPGGGNATGWRPGIDLRGLGGYVVMPPSRRADGKGWRWAAPPMRLAAAAQAVAS